jgi:hypothetical protein
MSEEYTDPSGNTAQFQAFVHRQEPAPATTRPVGVIIGGVAAVIVLLAIAVYLLMS